MSRRISDLLICLIGFAFVLAGVRPAEAADSFRRSWPVMGTYAEFQSLHDSPALNREAESVIRDVFDRVNRTMSTYDPNSDLSRLNRRAGQSALTVDPWLADLLRRGKKAARVTERAFSMDVLGYGIKYGLKPNGDTYELPPHGDRWIRFPAGGDRVFLAKRGMGLDLGGIAKGFALDKAVDRVEKLGLERFLVSLGRSIYAGAPPEGSRGWPVKVAGGTLHRMAHQYVSVSEQGIRSDTGHIIDPRSGRPVEASRRVIVFGRTGWGVDMASTALMVDPALRTRLLHQYPSLVRLIVRIR
jgi:thiamine biosynthesis lipoprotein